MPRALVLALSGELGAGKTTFTQGFMKGLGVRRRIQSPTFVVFKKFSIPAKKSPFATVIHVDAYRLNNARELRVLGFADELKKPKNIILIEWPERVKGIIPKHHIRISFSHTHKNERILSIREL